MIDNQRLDAPIHVIGLGIQQDQNLCAAARAALAQAEVVIGGARHLSWFPELQAATYSYPSPMEGLWALLQAHADKRIVLLASGDPLCYGIGALLLKHLEPERLVFYPNVSSIQAAFARIKRSWQQAQIISLHGRSLQSLRAVLRANQLYALLTDRTSHPVAIAGLLTTVGFKDSRLWIAEELGTSQERVRRFQADELANSQFVFSSLNVVIVETRGPGGLLPEFPGIPDEYFLTGEASGKGMLSKREVRLNILSLLASRAGEIGWDIGAGCGGVAVEWARWNPQGAVYAIECHGQRLQYLKANQERFGVLNNLHIVAGYAPEILTRLPNPDKVFIGGSQGNLIALLEAAWRRLPSRGRLVASAVTEDSRMELYRFVGEQPAQWTEISVAREDRLADQRVFRPQLPVLLMQLDKP